MRNLPKLAKLGWLSYLILSAVILSMYGENLSVHVINIIIASMVFVFFGVPLLHFLLALQTSKNEKSAKIFWSVLRFGLIATIIVTIASLALYFSQ